MCLSKVYEVKDGNENLICEYTSAISLDNGIIKLTDIMGEEFTVKGTLQSIDLANNIIKIAI